MFKIIHQSLCGNYISIQNTETTLTKSFSKIKVLEDAEGNLTEIKNANFVSEVEAFAGEGFLNA